VFHKTPNRPKWLIRICNLWDITNRFFGFLLLKTQYKTQKEGRGPGKGKKEAKIPFLKVYIFHNNCI
jgi:hypothetical protein